MFNRILLATDFSPHAEIAKQIATCLAQNDGNRLWAVTVLVPGEKRLTASPESPGTPRKERLLAQMVAEMQTEGVTVQELAREGDPDKQILAAAAEIDADVIVMGSHSHRNFWDVIIGSVAQKVAEKAPCPVIIVSHRPPHPGATTPKRYLLATDFSPHAALAEKVAISLAGERGEGRRLWVLTVIEPGEEIPMPPGFVVDAPDQAVTELETELRAEVEKAVGRRLDGIVSDARAQSVEAEKLIHHGHPDKEILKAAIDIEADMIIMGSHSRQSLRDKLMGDTPASVTKRAPCPVLVVSHFPEHRW